MQELDKDPGLAGEEPYEETKVTKKNRRPRKKRDPNGKVIED
jgi:hypothetical protein